MELSGMKKGYANFLNTKKELSSLTKEQINIIVGGVIQVTRHHLTMKKKRMLKEVDNVFGKGTDE